MKVQIKGGSMLRLLAATLNGLHRQVQVRYAPQIRYAPDTFTRLAEPSDLPLHQIVNHTPALIWMTNAQAQSIYFNQSWLNFTGRSLAQACGDGWITNIHPDDRPRFQEMFRQAVQARVAFSIEYRLRQATGEYGWVLDQGNPWFGEDQELIGYIGSGLDITASRPIITAQPPAVSQPSQSEDITDRKSVELDLQQRTVELEQRIQQRTQELTRSEQDLRMIFNNIYDAVCIHDLKGTILDVNDRALELYQASREQLVGATVTDLFAASAPTATIPEILHQLQTGKTLQLEWLCRRWDDQSSFDVEVSLRQIQLGNRSVILTCARDISDRKRAERALRESERRYATLAATAPVAICRFDQPFNCIYVSDRWSELTGRPIESALGRGWVDALHPEDRDALMAEWIQGYANPHPEGVISGGNEGRHLRPDGSINWFYVQVAPEIDTDGTIVGYIGTLTDITARKQMETELAESEAKFRRLVENAQDLIWSCDQAGRFTYLSPQFKSLFGWEPEEWLGQHFSDLLHPEDRPLLVNNNDYQEMVRLKQSSTSLEFRHRHRQGHYLWVRGSITAVQNAAGEIIGSQGILSDISDRKWAENALRESQQFIQTVLDTVPLSVFWKNRDSVFLGCNQQFADILGLSAPSAIIGKTDFDLSITAAEARAYRTDDQQVMDSGQIKLSIEESLTLPNGELRWIETHKAPLRDLDGNVVGMVGTFRDVTDRKQAAARLQQLNQELEQRVCDRTMDLQQAMEAAEAANRAKSIFLANMSHELRTPLNAILGFAQLMARDLSLSSEKRDQLNIITRSGQHLLDLINDILEMSKIEAGRMYLNINCFDLYGLLSTLQDMFQIRADEKSLRLLIDCPQPLPRFVKTDENKLRQVLINLLSNAIKFTPAGQVVLRIRQQELSLNALATSFGSPACLTPSSWLNFVVEDTGIGIDPEELDSLFEPFVQSKHQPLSQEGTGLGLAISRQFVQLMGGNLTVDSRLGNGAQFAFTIPVQLATAADLPAISPSRQILGLAPHQPSYRILVVEDNESNRQLLVQLLQATGFEVRAAQNGQEAIALWASWQPHLIWMDMRMPILDGYAATERIRQSASVPSDRTQPTAAPVIIALTASVSEADQSRMLAIGCNDFVHKPFRENELLEKIAEHLGVQYLYAASASEQAAATLSPPDAIATLQQLPADRVMQLHQAAMRLDSDLLIELLEPLTADYPDLTALLLERLDNFDFEMILNLLGTVSVTE